MEALRAFQVSNQEIYVIGGKGDHTGDINYTFKFFGESEDKGQSHKMLQLKTLRKAVTLRYTHFYANQIHAFGDYKHFIYDTKKDLWHDSFSLNNELSRSTCYALTGEMNTNQFSKK